MKTEHLQWSSHTLTPLQHPLSFLPSFSLSLSQRGQRSTINRSVLLMVSSACATVRLITLSAEVLERAVLRATYLINHTAWAAEHSLQSYAALLLHVEPACAGEALTPAIACFLTWQRGPETVHLIILQLWVLLVQVWNLEICLLKHTFYTFTYYSCPLTSNTCITTEVLSFFYFFFF